MASHRDEEGGEGGRGKADPFCEQRGIWNSRVKPVKYANAGAAVEEEEGFRVAVNAFVVG